MKRALMSLFVGSLLLTATPAFAQKKDPNNKSRYEKLELFNKVLYLIESQYYRDVDTNKLIEGAINGMMSTLDPHSAYLDKEVYKKMQEETSGEFGGLGIEVSQKDGVLIIITPIEDSPADKAGIKAQDRIVEINNESIVGLSLQQSIEKLRGKTKTKIILGIQREGVDGVVPYELTREIVQIKPVKFELIQKEYGYVRLSQFQKKSAIYVSDAITKMKKQLGKEPLKGIILDLRSNPGGLLDEAVDLSSIFLKEGIVVSTEGKDPKHKEIRYVKKTGHKELDVPVIVLINGSSASASEIVAGALQDYKRGIIMGTQSFGKGSVQSVAKIDDESGIKLTIAQYMTPKNRKIQAIGITPDILVDEAEIAWLEENKKEVTFIREKDLKNHLTATIETEDERKLREEVEKTERLERIENLKLSRDKKKKIKEGDKSQEFSKRVSPSEDYQVNQAINYFKSLSIIKKLNF